MSGEGIGGRAEAASWWRPSQRPSWAWLGVVAIALMALIAPQLGAGQTVDQTLLMAPRSGYYGEPYEAASGGFLATAVDATARAYVRPRRLAFATGGESVTRISRIRWSAWGRSRARGVGVARDCGIGGCSAPTRAIVTLGAATVGWCQRPAGNVRTFLHITFRVPASRQPPVRLAYGTPDIGWLDCRIHR